MVFLVGRARGLRGAAAYLWKSARDGRSGAERYWVIESKYWGDAIRQNYWNTRYLRQKLMCLKQSNTYPADRKTHTFSGFHSHASFMYETTPHIFYIFWWLFQHLAVSCQSLRNTTKESMKYDNLAKHTILLQTLFFNQWIFAPKFNTFRILEKLWPKLMSISSITYGSKYYCPEHRKVN